MLFFFVIASNLQRANAAKGLGHVVTNSNDTLTGAIYHIGFNKMIKVTLVQNGTKTDYTPEEIVAFGVGNDRWESIHLAQNGSRPDQYIFLKVVAKGNGQLLTGRYIVDGCGCDDFPKNAIAKGHFLKRQDGKVAQVFLRTFQLLDDPEYISQFLKAPELGQYKWVSLRRLKRIVEDTNS